MNNIPQPILDAYDIGVIESTTQITDGLIHATYLLETTTGRFILQRLHEVLSADEIGEDILAVTRHLKSVGTLAPEMILDRDGNVLHKFEDQVWRMQTAIAGRTHSVVPSEHAAQEAGKAFGELHRAFEKMNYQFKTRRLGHQTREILEGFKKTVEEHRADEIFDEVAADVELVLKTLPTLLLPESIPVRVVHGDPKISNVLFDENDHALAIIDLDTCHAGSILVDLGDAFRSWCGVEEDDPQNHFRIEIFEAGWRGYRMGAGGMITQDEVALVPQAVALITLELTARFLKDYFDDSYFGDDAERYESRRAQNLARARGQIALYRSIVEQWEAMNNIVSA